ncbi:MAG: lamin tail domain-containing protein, partial [Hymenobacteraceae bacterium]|nr:lamin tail domain-containing protein [Hymenobacteraceae bacterium]
MRSPRLLVALLLALVARPAAAQLTDSFADGDFTQNPPWIGDAADFTVNSSQQLQTTGAAVAAAKHLATASRVSGAATWAFWANLKFGTSSANYADVFLTSDSVRLTGANRGYFVRLGGTPDEVSLFRKDGSSVAPVIIVNGVDGLLASSTNNVVRVQVTRDAAGNWSLGADITGGTAYAAQGTARDTTYAASRWMGVVARYTATNAQKFAFDDIRITDTAPPTLRALTPVNATTLRLQFDEPVAPAPATTATTYSVTGVGTATSATIDPQDDAAVLLTFGSSFGPGLNTLRVNYAEDLYGNGTATALTGTFRIVAPPVVPVPGDIRLTELFVDPSPAVGLPSGQFVEVLNTTTRRLELLGWRLQDATAAAGGTLRAGSLAPGQYAILTATADTATYRALLGPTARIIGVTSFPTFNLSGDRARLLTPVGTVIDEVTYTDDWYRDPTKAQGGWSLEKISPTKLCSDADNWIASTDLSGGTPGRVNSTSNPAPDVLPPTLRRAIVRTPTRVELEFSEAIDSLTALAGRFTLTGGLTVTAVDFRTDSLRFVTLTLSGPLVPGTRYTLTATGIADCAGNTATPAPTATLLLGAVAGAGQVRITELFVDPSPVVGLPAARYVEILNVSVSFFDLNGWQIQDATGSAGALGAGLLAPGQYAVLTRTADTTTYRTFLGAGARIVGVTSLPSLNLTGDRVRLLTPAGLPVDEVTYTDDWYRDPVKNDGGWSLEKINPTRPCSDADNWIASADASGGTPGRQNSVFSTAPDTAPPVAQAISVLTSTTLRVEFSEAIDTLTATAARFVIAPGLTVTAVDFRADSLRFVTLTLSGPLTPGIRYTLTVSSIADCAGNVGPTTVLSFGLGDEPGLYDVLITEILADEAPVVNISTEFVEIHNPTSRVLTLAGVTLRKQGSSTNAAVFPAAATLAPGEYAVVCGSTRAPAFAGLGVAKIFPLTNFPTLNNSGDTLVLRRANGQLLFSVAYADSWYRDAVKADGGWSLEMIDRAKPCSLAPNWAASRDGNGGSPGRVNSRDSTLASLPAPALGRVEVVAVDGAPRALRLVFTEKLDSAAATSLGRYAISGGPALVTVGVRGPEFREVVLGLATALTPGQRVTLTVSGLVGCGGASQSLTADVLVPEAPRRGVVVINEILFNPRPGGYDFVEVLNRSTRQLDLRGYLLANTRGDSLYQIRPLPGFELPPGALAVLTTEPDSVARQYPASADRARFVRVASMPTFSDDAGTVVLLAPDSTGIDSLRYDARQHTPLLTD